MNSFLLMTALRDRLAPALADLPLATRTRTSAEVLARPATVHVGSLPPKTGDSGFDAPLVLIQAMSGHSTDEGVDMVEVALRLVVWSDENGEAGENDLHNLLALVRRSVLACRQQALSGRYLLTANDKGECAPWNRPDEQAPPFVEAYILSLWKMQGPY